jgi:hypothetical protein
MAHLIDLFRVKVKGERKKEKTEYRIQKPGARRRGARG